ncbi:MAG TPA: hypothetical protein PLI65_00685 [Bacteroidales bacterium]|nr:hypothetical protein [Bacteroidales bacterium]HPR57757.1 hypothetical protein [Bacteroidales bacterium]
MKQDTKYKMMILLSVINTAAIVFLTIAYLHKNDTQLENTIILPEQTRSGNLPVKNVNQNEASINPDTLPSEMQTQSEPSIINADNPDITYIRTLMTADSLYHAGNYTEARKMYLEAYHSNNDYTYPMDKIRLIDTILAFQKREIDYQQLTLPETIIHSILDDE